MRETEQSDSNSSTGASAIYRRVRTQYRCGQITRQTVFTLSQAQIQVKCAELPDHNCAGGYGLRGTGTSETNNCDQYNISRAIKYVLIR